eukprot:symbB.v1.2.002319.t1/scaffold123.1/size315817/4
MLDMLRSPGTPKASPLLSLEVEKPSLEVKEVLPLLHRCDVVFFSSDFMRARAKELESEGEGDHHAAMRGLQALAAKAKAKHALLICPWGSTGAFALDTVTMESFFQPSEKVEAVDSLGAGDTFIAASLYALASGASVQEALRCACAVAGGKELLSGPFLAVRFGDFCGGAAAGVSVFWLRGCNLDSSTCRAEAPRDCKFSSWRDWSTCSKLCDGGQRSRDRPIEVYPANLGRPCHGSLDQTQPCNTQLCAGEKRYDCLWKPWEEWEACTQSCDGGQRTRRRALVDARGHGTACQAGSTMEVAACNTNNCWTMTEVCAWADWSPYSACTRTCDSGQQTRLRRKAWQSPSWGTKDFISRRLLPSPQGPRECLGRQKEIRACGLTPCSMSSEAMDCQWDTWDDWGACSCSGLQQRHRGIRVEAFLGGIPCVGVSQDSKSCQPSTSCTSVDIDCSFGSWTQWSDCSVTCGNGQRYHTRAVITHAQASGRECHGGLEEVETCQEDPCADSQDCTYTEWSSWAPCSRECGGGEHMRSRVVARIARSGGAACPEADLEETGLCNTQDCVEDAWGKIDCTWSEWSSWGRCSASCGLGQARRSRIIVQEAAHGGEFCAGLFQDFQNCSIQPCRARDCAFSAWTSWSDCSDRCTGHRQRVRNVGYPAFGGGEACRGSTMELQPCGEGQNQFCLSHADAVDCIFGPWTSWSACSRECGGGQHISSRQVVRNAQAAGIPCAGALRRVEVCSQHFCPGDEPRDCKLGAWGLWQPCTKSCGGGEALRSRPVSQEPRNGGRPCPEMFAREVQECNTQACPTESSCRACFVGSGMVLGRPFNHEEKYQTGTVR